MDITKFNRELGKKITMAKSLENRNDIEAAIKLWIEISEMTLNLLKSKNLEVSFRNMLMNRTKGIFKHINQLKGDKSEEEEFREKIKAQDDLDSMPSVDDKMEVSTSSEEMEIQIKKQKEDVDHNTMKIIKDSEFKYIPNGFKEIKASEDYEIITPHDKDYVQKYFNQIGKRDISNQEQKEKSKQLLSSNHDGLEFNQPEGGKTKICFACGAEIAGNKKICPNCGANI
ncbi:MAG: zinc ribbon domain-containing protein [Promethearchaeota archaeon]